MSDPPSLSWGCHWRSTPSFIIATVAIGLSTDHFLYGIVVPLLPFMLRDRLYIPDAQLQLYTSRLLAAYAGAAVLFAIPAGWIADKIQSRQSPFLAGLLLLIVATSIFTFGQSITALVIARLLQGMSAAVVWTTGLAMTQDAVGPEKLGQAIGTVLSVSSIGELAAPAVGGILYDKAGIFAVFKITIGILAIDLIMRLLVIENKEATERTGSRFKRYANANREDSRAGAGAGGVDAREDDALLHQYDSERYKINGSMSSLLQATPVIYCFREPRFLMALLLSLIQGSLMGVFDATVPTQAESLFQLSSLGVGFLFIAIVLPFLALGPVAGLAVDRYGTKTVATIGYAFLVPSLVLLSLPSHDVNYRHANLTFFCAALSLNGIGLAIVGSPGFVEANDVTQKYHKANPELFGDNGPYAQLYGFFMLFFFTGLTVGPLLGGLLRDHYGYGIMTIVFAALSGCTALLSLLLLGEREPSIGAT